jgi:hypothetical protein
MTRLKVGLALSLGAAAVGTLLAGWRGAVAAGSFGLIATAIQLLAARSMQGRDDAPIRDYMRGWAGGTGLRMLGVVLVGVVIWLDSASFPPIPAAMGYIGVLVPLLFYEARRV